MARIHPAGNMPEWDTLKGGFLDLARTEHSVGIIVEEQSQQYFWCYWFSSWRSILCIDRAQIQLGDYIHHKSCQMVGRQDFFQTNVLFE